MPGTLLSVSECTLIKGNGEHADDGKKSQKMFYVRYSSKPEDHDEVLNAAGLPAVGAELKSGDSRKLKSKSAASMGTVLDYVVTCDYEVPEVNATYSPNPLDRPDVLSGSFSTEQVTFFKDTEGTAVVNSAAQPFENLPQRYVGVFRFRVSGNRATTTPAATWAGYLYPACATNNASVVIRGYTFAAKTLLIMGMSFSPERENEYDYQKWEWELAYNPEEWNPLEIDDRGYYEWDSVEFQLKAINVNEPSELTPTPWPLDGNGAAKLLPSATPAVLEFKPYYEKDFSVFGFTA